MAEDKPKRIIKKSETVRQRVERASVPKKTRRINGTAGKVGGVVGKPFKAAHRVGQKEFYLPISDKSRFGRFMNKRRSAVPGYFKQAWEQLKQVVWPDKRTTIRLSIAVFVFSAFFILITTVIDYGLDKLFKKVFL